MKRMKLKRKTDYIGDYKGNKVYTRSPCSGEDSPVLILWNREESQVVSGIQTAEILNTMLDLNNREYERIDGVYPGYVLHDICICQVTAEIAAPVWITGIAAKVLFS